MIYYYKFRIEYIKGDKRILKDYEVDFLSIGKLFFHLETKHKDNYKLMWIKERKPYYNKYNKEI